jgi:hypothetical protein
MQPTHQATLTIAAQNQIKTGEVEEIHRGYVPEKADPNAVRATLIELRADKADDMAKGSTRISGERESSRQGTKIIQYLVN